VSTLAKTTSLASSRGKTTAFTVLVNRVANPVNTGIVTNLEMRRIHKDDFIVLHGSILVHPVRIENTKVGKLASNLFFCDGLKVSLEFELVDTLILGLTKDHTAVIGALASSTTDSNTDNDVSLFGLVSEAVCLFGTSGSVAADHLGALTVFPCTDTKEETKCITLLVTPEFFHILVGSHVVDEIYMDRVEMRIKFNKKKYNIVK
jgi:hypothetical protein